MSRESTCTIQRRDFRGTIGGRALSPKVWLSQVHRRMTMARLNTMIFYSGFALIGGCHLHGQLFGEILATCFPCGYLVVHGPFGHDRYGITITIHRYPRGLRTAVLVACSHFPFKINLHVFISYANTIDTPSSVFLVIVVAPIGICGRCRFVRVSALYGVTG